MAGLSAGLRADQLDRLEKSFEAQTEQGHVLGIVALVARNGIVAKAVVTGWEDEERKKPMRRDAVFRIGSMTKPITAAAALVLIEEGRLGLESPIEHWLPQFSRPKVLRDAFGAVDAVEDAVRPITVLDLLTHRSGLAYAATLPAPLGEALSRVDLFADAAGDNSDWVSTLAALPLAWQPGTRFQYGLSSDVLGILIQRVAGMPLLDFLKERLFAPLGMDDTGFFVEPDKRERLTAAFRRDADASHALVDHPSSSKWANPNRFQGGGGGLVSTADDYLRFAEMLLGRGKLEGSRILSPRSVGLMTCNWLTPEQRAIEVFGRHFFAGQGYGLGVSVTDDPALQEQQVGYSSVGSFGWSGIYGTSWLADPKERMNLIYMSQLSSTEMTLGQAARLAAGAYGAIDD